MQRRRLLTGLCALGVGIPRVGSPQQSTAPGAFPGAPGDASAPPRLDDWLVFAYGDRAGQVIAPADLAVGTRQVFAFPMDPAGAIVRSANRLNQVVVVRLDPSWLSEETRARSADGIVAYSGVCTHTGCDVDLWVEEQNRFQCMCHESQFDPADAARVVGGPAPMQLAALPLKLVEGRLAVAGPFVGPVGFQPAGAVPLGL